MTSIVSFMNDFFNNSDIAVHLCIQRKLNAGFINEMDAKILRNWLANYELETGVFDNSCENANVNIYKQKCTRMINFLERTYPETK